jgi:cell division septation protein DedD
MVITPLVVRSQDIPDSSATEIWSGSADRWSVETPFEVQSAQDKRYRRKPRKGILEILDENAPPAEPEEIPPAAAPPMSQYGLPAPAAAESADSITSRPQTPPRYGTGWPENAIYSIHVGSYLDQNEAEKRAQQLTGLNYQCFLIPAQIPRKGFFHRIYIGAYTAKTTAEDACRRYRRRQEFPLDIHVVDRQWAMGS